MTHYYHSPSLLSLLSRRGGGGGIPRYLAGGGGGVFPVILIESVPPNTSNHVSISNKKKFYWYPILIQTKEIDILFQNLKVNRFSFKIIPCIFRLFIMQNLVYPFPEQIGPSIR